MCSWLRLCAVAFVAVCLSLCACASFVYLSIFLVVCCVCGSGCVSGVFMCFCACD